MTQHITDTDLLAYVLGELEEPEELSIEAHSTGCPTCGERLAHHAQCQLAMQASEPLRAHAVQANNNLAFVLKLAAAVMIFIAAPFAIAGAFAVNDPALAALWGDTPEYVSPANRWGQVGYHPAVIDIAPQGRQDANALHLGLDDPWFWQFTGAAQVADATPYWEKEVVLTAWVKSKHLTDGRAALWLRADQDGKMVGFDNMADRPFRGTEWTELSATIVVPAGADQLVFGALLDGHGEAWFDDFSLTCTGCPSPGVVNPSFLDTP